MRISKLLLLSAVLLSSCSHQGRKAEFFAPSAVNLVWPALPEQPRIKLLKIFYGAAEFVAPKSTFNSLFEALTGERPQPVAFMAPAGIAADGERYIYVADPSARLVHRVDFIANEVSYLTNAGAEALASPVGVALDSNGVCYVTDSVKARVYKYGTNGEFIGAIGGVAGDLQRPAGIAIGRNDYKYIADVIGNKVLVFDAKDRFVGEIPDSSEKTTLNRPVNVAVDSKGNIYVTDAFNFAIKVFNSAGRLIRSIGTAGDGPGTFARPKGIAIDSEDHIYIIDASFDNFQIFSNTGQLLLYVGSTGKQPGQFFMPNGVFIDHDDKIYIADSYNQRIQIFQYLKETQKK
jgi:DNA-binding beta-propeller fold protein YncE